uniref:ATP-binding protein n=1 Tax=Succinivibrio sp. TaxID=2053619 RepID=UPI00402AE04D
MINFYKDIDKSHFFLGRIIQVNRDYCVVQVENNSLLSHRLLANEVLDPNSINYNVVIENEKGLYLGEVFSNNLGLNDKAKKSVFSTNDDLATSCIYVNLIGLKANTDELFKLPGNSSVGISDKVYVANSAVDECYLRSIDFNNYESNGKDDSNVITVGKYLASNKEDVELNVNSLFNRHLLVVGATNSGKSTSSLSILNALVKQGKKVLIIDPTGEYKDSFNIDEFKKVTLGEDCCIYTKDVSIAQFGKLFNVNSNSQGPALADAITSLRLLKKRNSTDDFYKKAGKTLDEVCNELAELDDDSTDFDLEKLPDQLVHESVSLNPKKGLYNIDNFRKNSNDYLIRKIKFWIKNKNLTKIFSSPQSSSSATNLFDVINDFLDDKTSCLYIDASQLGLVSELGSVVIDLICYHILQKKEKFTPFVFFIDEVHRYTMNDENDLKSNGLSMAAREGRKKGMFLFLTTQNPSDIPLDVMSQIGSILVHRLTSGDEIKAIENYLDKSSLALLKKLNQGEAILSSINIIKNLYLKINKSNLIHHNETPSL